MIDREACQKQDDGEVGAMISLLSEQRDLYARLASLADHQRSLIADREPERLLEVLGERQKIVDRLESLAERLRPRQRQWQQIREQMADSERQRADQLVSETNALLSAIIQKDEADVQLLAESKTSTATNAAGLKKKLDENKDD